MAIIQDKMARPEGDDINAETVKENIKMPPELQNAYEKVVIAGMKVMFSKQSHKLMLEELQKEGPLSEKLGKGIAGLMLLLVKQSNNTMPPEVIIPAGVNLLSQAADFIRKTKLENITNSVVCYAMETMITTLLDKFDVDSEKMKHMTDQSSTRKISSGMGLCS